MTDQTPPKPKRSILYCERCGGKKKADIAFDDRNYYRISCPSCGPLVRGDLRELHGALVRQMAKEEALARLAQNPPKPGSTRLF